MAFYSNWWVLKGLCALIWAQLRVILHAVGEFRHTELWPRSSGSEKDNWRMTESKLTQLQKHPPTVLFCTNAKGPIWNERLMKTVSIFSKGQGQSCLQSRLLINAIVNKSVVRELVSVKKMLEEVGAFVSGISPWHGRAHRTHHFVRVIPMVLHAVLYQLLLVQIPDSTEWAHKCRAVWNIAWYGLWCGKNGNKLGTISNLFLNFRTWCNMGLHFDQRHLFTAATTWSFQRWQLFLHNWWTLYLLGVKRDATQWAEGRGDLEAGLEALTTKSVCTVGDAHGLVVDFQTDRTGELALNILGRDHWPRAGSRPGSWSRLRLLRPTELAAGGNKAPKHRHHGACVQWTKQDHSSFSLVATAGAFAKLPLWQQSS